MRLVQCTTKCRNDDVGVTAPSSVLEEQLFVADLLGELTRELAERLHASSHIDWRAVNNTSE